MELHRTPGWTSRIFKAIDRWPDEHVAVAAVGGDLHRPGQSALPAGRARRVLRASTARRWTPAPSLLWPEEEDLYTLMCMRVESGRTAFEREKQNSPINPELCEWPEAYFDETIWFDDWPANLAVKTLALDPSKGSDARRGDYSAFVMLGVDRQGMLYVEADLARRPTPQIVADGVELVPPLPARRVRRRGQPVPGPAGRRVRGRVPPPGHARRARPWPHRQPRRTSWCASAGSARTCRAGGCASRRDSPGTRLLVEQLQQFPIGDHDDGPDAAGNGHPPGRRAAARPRRRRRPGQTGCRWDER